MKTRKQLNTGSLNTGTKTLSNTEHETENSTLLPHKDGYGMVPPAPPGGAWLLLPAAGTQESSSLYVTADRDTRCFSLQPFGLSKQYSVLLAALSFAERDSTRTSCDRLLSPHVIWRISSCH